MSETKVTIIDASGLILGRLASIDGRVGLPLTTAGEVAKNIGWTPLGEK